jgi:hypothetical protein
VIADIAWRTILEIRAAKNIPDELRATGYDGKPLTDAYYERAVLAASELTDAQEGKALLRQHGPGIRRRQSWTV